jgi:hypothetical protein
MGMGVYVLTATDSLTQLLNMTLLAQTAEVTFANPMDGIITLNLPTPLAVGQSYFIGWQADASLSLPLSYWWLEVGWPIVTFDAYNSSGLPGQLSAYTSYYGDQNVLLIGGNSCLASSGAITQFSFCATIVNNYYVGDYFSCQTCSGARST